jgi:zinc transporter ZupT
MFDFFRNFNPVTQAFIATLFTWGMTALGATLVFATRTVNQRLLDSMSAPSQRKKKKHPIGPCHHAS